jgi:TM2 domain-containing membrane protein YozV
MKSKTTAYALLILLGGIGAHQFYLGKKGKGIFYICTLGGIFGLFPLIDLFTLGGQVDAVNTKKELKEIRSNLKEASESIKVQAVAA